MSDTIHRIKVALQQRLLASPLIALNSIPIFVDDEANLQGKIDSAISGKSSRGVFGIVTIPNGKDNNQNPFAPLVYQAAIQFHEHRFINRLTNENADSFNGTNILAEELAEHARLLCKSLNYQGFFQCIPTINALTQITADMAFGDWGWTVHTDIQSLVAEFSGKCQTPQIVIVDNVATVTCATAGASIYYTLDSTYPSAVSATLYAGPVNVTEGQAITACAYLQSNIPSDIAVKTN